ncbi:MAG: penicillin acylase family protein [Deltaproteobacteria bacterium]|nr:penicillin acylase family protein [Deltaproteobacteria bacterium]
MRGTKTTLKTMAMLAALAMSACGSDNGGDKDATAPLDAVEVADQGSPGEDIIGEDIPDNGAAPVKCLGRIDPDQSIALSGLTGTVEVVRDQWGIPHIYASNNQDLFFAQGYIQAMDRAVQMQGMRLITHGLYERTATAGPSDVGNDVYMRLLDFQGVSEKEWADIQANDPELAAVLDSYSKGVTAFFKAAEADKSLRPLEWAILAPFEAWTPVDVLMIGRLQVWDLSFDGQTDEISMMTNIERVMEKFAGTDLEGLAIDAYRSAPAADAFILGTTDRQVSTAVARPPRDLLKRLPKGYFTNLSERLGQVTVKPGVPFGVGSNNWAISGDLTASGNPMVAGDPHLSLRNPSVWYQVHLNTTRAGGDLDINGVTFPGVPGILLGHSQYAAWMATVHYYDVTDVYIETFSKSDPGSVMFEGGEVQVVSRPEVFTYKAPKDGCESWLNDFVKGLTYTVKEEDGKCILNVAIEVVPHHGPIIPGSRATLPNGDKIAMTWRWTGFEPTNEMKAFAGLWTMKNPDDFFATLQNYGVGAQNIVYGDTNGNIAYAAFAHVPIRKNVAEGKGHEHPPWLPMPGDGCCEWTGYVPTTDLPQTVNPTDGYVITANNDATGATQDNDPLNDPYYTTHAQDLGYRAARIHEVLTGVFAQKKVDIADMQATQADHLSPLGRDLTPAILEALAEGQKAVDQDPQSDPKLVPFMTPEVIAAGERLKEWNYEAESGVGTDETAAQKTSSVAASIFNAWLVFLNANVFDNKGLQGLEDQYRAKLLVAMINYPDQLATYSADLKESLIWDDASTVEETETRQQIILKSLKQAVEFLADPAAVGPGENGGFGTDDMEKWLWGELHTVTFRHPLGGEANIPKGSEFKNGFPRHGDNYNVDACNPGLKDTNFTYRHGPSMRGVYVLDPDGITMENAIPGGQVADLKSPHYADDAALWAVNKTHPVYDKDDDVIDAAESCTIFSP